MMSLYNIFVIHLHYFGGLVLVNTKNSVTAGCTNPEQLLKESQGATR